MGERMHGGMVYDKMINHLTKHLLHDMRHEDISAIYRICFGKDIRYINTVWWEEVEDDVP